MVPCGSYLLGYLGTLHLVPRGAGVGCWGRRGQAPGLAGRKLGLCSVPCLPEDFASPGDGQLLGTLGINCDLDSLKARKFFLVSDLNLPCSQYVLTQTIHWFLSLSFFLFFFLATEHFIKNETPIYKHIHGAAMYELGWDKHAIVPHVGM